jgi:hypothetical protein
MPRRGSVITALLEEHLGALWIVAAYLPGWLRECLEGAGIVQAPVPGCYMLPDAPFKAA